MWLKVCRYLRAGFEARTEVIAFDRDCRHPRAKRQSLFVYPLFLSALAVCILIRRPPEPSFGGLSSGHLEAIQGASK
jgi:hypothetical protein